MVSGSDMSALGAGVGGARIDLSVAPEAVSAGLAVHGVRSLSDWYHLPYLWQLHLYRYDGDLIVDGRPYRIRPGAVSLLPPGTFVEFRYLGRSEHFYAHFRAPVGADGEGMLVPHFGLAGGQVPSLTDMMAGVVGAVGHNPAHASAELWAALWRVAMLAAHAEKDAPHPSVTRATAYIEAKLAERLAVSEIARVAAVSGNQLTRLFRAHTGLTVVGYIRLVRMQRARHLLRESTIPVAAVAASVGIPDLHAFNKACRREFGCSPRQLRSRTLQPEWTEEHRMTDDLRVRRLRNGIPLLPTEVREEDEASTRASVQGVIQSSGAGFLMPR
jgi:AraC family transcriptional regulator